MGDAVFGPSAGLEISRTAKINVAFYCKTQYPVSPAVAELGTKRRAFLREVIAHPGITTYELSRKQGRDYSRAYKDQRLLLDKNLLWIREEKHNGRKIHRLYASDSVNTALAS